MYKRPVAFALVECLLQSRQHEVGARAARHAPTHKPAGKHVRDECHIGKTFPGRHVGEIRHPQGIRTVCMKLPPDMVLWIPCGFVADRRTNAFAANNAFQAHATHQSSHRAACHTLAFAVQLVPDFAHAIDTEVILPDTADINTQLLVTLNPWRRLGGIGLALCVRVVRRRSNRQDLADRPDSVGVTMGVNERRHFFGRRSSSAWAKYAEALRSISLAWRSSRFSRSSALMRSRSSVVGPGRMPWSRSACRTQLRSVSAVQPTFVAIEPRHAH